MRKALVAGPQAGFAWLLALALLLVPWAALGRGEAPGRGIAAVRLAELPPEARATYALIFAGGPFPYEKDGTVFGNRERLLPLHKRGYYREYTVTTPGSRDRGMRRIVCGGKPQIPEVCYYTSDHYTSFRRIVE
ncbi:MAG: ribonuclease N [Burkholderiaceae bacterium]|jgi:Guanyl-specific ribonuclease Sa|nr:ribonuclease N [Burkholderiaceae bacterium]